MRRPWRIPALLLLPLLVVVGLVAEGRDADAPPDARRLAELTTTAAAPDTLGSTWYCAAGTATGTTTGESAGVAEQRVILSNVADEAATGTLTVFAQDGTTEEMDVSVAGQARSEVLVSQQMVTPWAAVLVEVVGGEVTVAHELTGPEGRSVSDCASRPSATWYFPAGTTRVGTSMYLALFNPFPGEATVDVAFDTDDGARTPEEFSGIVVAGGSVVVKDVSAAVTLREHLSMTVSTRSGRIVAEQVQTSSGRDGQATGLTATGGLTAPQARWSFPADAPAGDAAGGAGPQEAVALFNPGDTDAKVLVQVQLDDPATNGTVEPFEVVVAAHRYATVDVSGDGRVPPGVGHWILVRTEDGSEVVAARTLAGGASGGLTYTSGLPVVGTRWLAPVASSTGVAASRLTIANPSPGATATVTVRRHGGGTAADVADATSLTVAPGERVQLDLVAAGFAADTSVEVLSDVPVAVGQWMSFSSPKDMATPVAIPVAGTQSVLVDVVDPAAPDVDPEDLAPSDVDGSVPPDPSAPDASTPTTTAGSSTTTTAG